MLHDKHSEKTRSSCSTIHAGGHDLVSNATTASVLTLPTAEAPAVAASREREHRRALVARTFAFIGALFLHSSVEGFSFGVQSAGAVLPVNVAGGGGVSQSSFFFEHEFFCL